MRWRIPLLLTVVAFVAVSCDQQPVGPANDQAVVEAPSFNWMNNRDNGNPRIYRSETDWVYCWSDAEGTDNEPNGLRACHGTLPLGDGTETDCGLQEGGDPVEFQEVGLFEDLESLIHAVHKGELFITIRDQTQPGNCFGDALVAQGYGKFMYVDNNILASTKGGAMNAFEVKANSNALETPDGQRVNYRGHHKYRFFFETGRFFITSAKVDVNVH
jgi:hypothetical protein